MITPKGIKKAVRKNEGHVSIPSRADMDNMVYFVADLLMEAGYEEMANGVRNFYYELEDIPTSEILKEEIWVGWD